MPAKAEIPTLAGVLSVQEPVNTLDGFTDVLHNIVDHGELLSAHLDAVAAHVPVEHRHIAQALRQGIEEYFFLRQGGAVSAAGPAP